MHLLCDILAQFAVIFSLVFQLHAHFAKSVVREPKDCKLYTFSLRRSKFAGNRQIMKYIATLLLVFCSLIVGAQDINFELAGANHKKWVGDDLVINDATENTTALVFYSNHTVLESNSKSKKK